MRTGDGWKGNIPLLQNLNQSSLCEITARHNTLEFRQ